MINLAPTHSTTRESGVVYTKPWMVELVLPSPNSPSAKTLRALRSSAFRFHCPLTTHPQAVQRIA